MSTMDASGASSSIHPTVEAVSCMDDGSDYAVSACDVAATYADDVPGCTISAYDVMATTCRATFAMGIPDAPSSIYSPTDVAIGCAPLVDSTVTPAPV